MELLPHGLPLQIRKYFTILISKSTVQSVEKQLREMTEHEKTALADRLMGQNPNFLCPPLTLTKVEAPAKKAECAIDIALLLALCHEEQHRAPLPQVTEQMMSEHSQKVVNMFEYLKGKPVQMGSDAIYKMTLNHPEQQVYSCICKMMTDAGVFELRTDEDPMVVICVLTLLSVFTELQKNPGQVSGNAK